MLFVLFAVRTASTVLLTSLTLHATLFWATSGRAGPGSQTKTCMQYSRIVKDERATNFGKKPKAGQALHQRTMPTAVLVYICTLRQSYVNLVHSNDRICSSGTLLALLLVTPFTIRRRDCDTNGGRARVMRENRR